MIGTRPVERELLLIAGGGTIAIAGLRGAALAGAFAGHDP